MRTASLTVRWEGWWACVVRPSAVEQSSLSTEFDQTLKCPGSWETSVLSLVIGGGERGLPGKLTIGHLLTAFSKLGLLPPIVWRSRSSRPVLVVGPCLI